MVILELTSKRVTKCYGYIIKDFHFGNESARGNTETLDSIIWQGQVRSITNDFTGE